MPLHPLLIWTLIFTAPACPRQQPCQITHRGAYYDPADADSHLLIQGDLLMPDGLQRNGSLLIRAGQIIYAGPSHHSLSSSSSNLAKSTTTIIVCDSDNGAVISPGFINTHEHLAYSTVSPFRFTSGERFGARHDWRLGLRGHTKLEPAVNGTKADAVKWGELRHLFSGTTAVVGGDAAPGLVRNLDFVDALGGGEGEGWGLGAPTATWAVFPLDDAEGGILRDGDCEYGAGMLGREEAGRLHRLLAHVAEGVDAEARNEFLCLSDEGFDTRSTDIMAPNAGMVHALGLTERDFDLVAERGVKVVWSPRSNVALYGRTLDVRYLLERGITVALGTDWLPSGSATMGREAVCAAEVTRGMFGVELGPKTLWEMMTVRAAEVAGFEGRLGSLKVGNLADVVVWSGDRGADPYARAAFGKPEDIELVLRGGKVMLTSEGLRDLAADRCESLRFGNVRKVACVADELRSTFEDFVTSLGGVYPAVLSGAPPNEPPCQPLEKH